MVNKKKRLFKILFFPISLLICLSIFMISSFAQSGYNIDNNGNITSLNLVDVDFDQTQSNLRLSIDGSVMTLFGSNNNSSDLYYNVNLFSNCVSGRTYSLKFYSDNFSFYNNFYDTWVDGNHYWSNSNGELSVYMTDSIKNASWRFVLASGSYNTTIRIMLNEGSSFLDYFPYGSYYYSNVNQNYSIYNIFNGVQVWLSNLTSDGAIVSETLSLSLNQSFITFSDLPNIRSYILNHPDSEPYSLVFYFGPNNKQNASYVITLNSYDWQPTIHLSGFSDKVYNRNNNSNTFVVNTFNESYQSLSIIDFESSSDVLNSFRLSLVQADTSYYNNGYTNGYSDGFNDGENVGYNSGYQSGYNTGSTTNIETNGIKTLFNSILSFPVDMIKSVFNFDFMGVNVASVIMFIVSIGIVAFVLKKFL